MFIEAKLVFQSYMPKRLEEGMLFQRKVSMRKLKTNIEYKEVFELKDIPRDTEAYILINGWPVEPRIYSLTSNPDAAANILAIPEIIGWWDEEPGAEYEEGEEGTLRDIQVSDYNFILENYDGSIDIEVKISTDENGEEIAIPIIYMDKVTLSIPMEKSSNEKDDDEESDWDVTSGDGLEKEEPWDDMDDEPEYDGAGFTSEDEWPFDNPKDKTDYDPE
jgi:hypothetical protein